MTITAIIAYSIALAIAAAIPGPGIAAMIGRALGVGWLGSLPMLAGLIAGDLVYLTFAVLGLAVLATAFSGVFFVVKIAGCLYLLFLAWRFWSAGIELRNIETSEKKRDGFASFFGGLAVTLGNPKTIVFYMAILPSVVDLTTIGPAEYAALFALTIGILVAVIIPYLLVAERARQVFNSPKALSRLNKSAASAMAATAGWIALKA